jgi:4-amino-4-deoxy-L-arabinose transferase-like glycosyltransferase
MSSDVAKGSGAKRAFTIIGWAVACGLAIAGFYDGRKLNSGFALPTKGSMSVPESEQVFYLWYAVCGTFAIVCLARLLTELGAVRTVRGIMELAVARPAAWICAIALAVFAACLGFRRAVLLGQPVTDDEGTYVFIARTLLAGRFTNPVPEDAEFFKNQFIVINEHGWHGKYPIGHPLVLALGDAIGAIDLVVPLMAAGGVWLTYFVGRRLFDERVALVGASLLLVSPHWVWTGGTLLSQPTACVAMLAGVLLVCRLDEKQQLRDAAFAGLVFGFGVLVRPLPGVLFGLAAAAQIAVAAHRSGTPAVRGLARIAVFGLGVAPWIALFGLVNQAQSGSPFTSGYQEYHGDLKIFWNDRGQVVNSIVGALVRENFWLLGWTFGLVLLLWARPARYAVAFWGMLAAELAYRVIAPKTVVAVTGPIYLTEVVPLLTLAAADALQRIGRFFRAHSVRPSIAAVAATLIGACMFAPLPLHAVATGAATRRVVYDLLEKAQAEHALIFSNAAVYPKSAVTWAYFPDNPSPQFDDPWLFVRVPTTPDMRQRMVEFWRKHFPNRRAFVFAMAADGPRFSELSLP